MDIQLIVFDIAGTTVQDDHHVCDALQQALHQHGYTEVPDGAVNRRMGYPKRQAIREVLQEHAPDAARISDGKVEAIHETFQQAMLTFYRDSPELRPTDQAEETLQMLKDMNIKIGLNTGFSRQVADTIMERLQWKEQGLIDYLIASDEVSAGRPAPDMIHKLMQMAGVAEAQQVAKVGDTAVDVLEGQAAGCACNIAVTTGAYQRKDLEACHPTHVIDHISEVITIIQQYQHQPDTVA